MATKVIGIIIWTLTILMGYLLNIALASSQQDLFMTVMTWMFSLLVSYLILSTFLRPALVAIANKFGADTF